MTVNQEPALPWDTISKEEREAVLRGAFLGCHWRRRDSIKLLPERPRERGEDTGVTLLRIRGRWMDRAHELALLDEQHRVPKTTIRPIKWVGRKP